MRLKVRLENSLQKKLLVNFNVMNAQNTLSESRPQNYNHYHEETIDQLEQD